MLIASRWRASVTFPPVGMNCRPWPHSLSNELQQAFRGDIHDTPQPDTSDSPSIFLRRNHNDGLFLDLMTCPVFSASSWLAKSKL